MPAHESLMDGMPHLGGDVNSSQATDRRVSGLAHVPTINSSMISRTSMV